MNKRWNLSYAIILLAITQNVRATDPEIMVHEGDLAERGEVVATIHANYTFRGSRESGDSTWPSDKLTNLMAEFATGLAPGWEIGLHLPIMRAGINSDTSTAGAWGSSGAMGRLKYIHEFENGVFLGFNGEFAVFAQRFAVDTRGIEMRGIAGYDAERYRLTINPVLCWGLGSRVEDHAPEFALSGKALYKHTERMGFGVEFYSNWDAANNLLPGDGDRIAYLVGEFALGDNQGLHIGFGKGFKDTPEREVAKIVWSTSF